jgi:hypothetical protein
MSIFKDTFKQGIQNQLKARENALVSRTPTAIQYFNSRNSWVRMTSAVEVENDDGALAKKNVLLGGVLFDKQLRTGIGVENQAYSTVNTNGVKNRLGLRPMPGITSVEVRSRGAYGSLRDVTINFQCWDIRQLEDLELLYMRPGYTVLVEWGWMPYLNSNGSLGNSVDFIDDVLNAKKSNPSRNSILKKIFTKASENSNYDAHYGYVKQYGWSSREDGGYDCTVTIISVGEIIESLKINYSPLNYSSQVYGGLLTKNVKTKAVLDYKKLRQNYTRNILAGLFYELWEIGREVDNESSESFTDTAYNTLYDVFHKNININGGTAEATSDGSVGESDEQVYITLATLFILLNNYVLPKSNNGEKIIKCSVLDREYLGTLSPKPDTGEGGYLLCLAHPLQISMDPTICAIKSNLWIDGFKINSDTIATGTEGNNVVRFSNTNFVPLFNKLGFLLSASDIDKEQAIAAIVSTTGQQINEFRELQRQYLIILDAATKGKGVPPELKGLQNSFFTYVKEKKPSSFYNLMDNFLNTTEIQETLGTFSGDVNGKYTQKLEALTLDPSISANNELDRAKSNVEDVQDSSKVNNISYLKNLKRPYFYLNDYNTELGIIGNIYVNVNFLYRLAIGGDLESLDSKEKQEINLYDFLKSVASEISNSTGNVNNFEVYVDPQDDVIRIIDVNYVDVKKNRDEIYQKLYEVQLHNLKSTTRSYKLESQIFPDQSSIVAIGAQVGGGAMATDNNTWLDFNKNIKDRVIEKKIDALANNNEDSIGSLAIQLESLKQSLSSIYDFFAGLEDWYFLDSDYDADKAGAYKNSLRDLILFFKNLTNSDIKNRSIIPTKLSVTLDGIGGLVIGHMFKIPEDLLPRGYKGGLVGSKLGYITTGIGHSIGGGDWTTTIDAQTIILDNPSGSSFSFNDIIIGNISGSAGSPPTTVSPVKVTAVQAPIVKKYGEVGDKSKIVTLNLPYTLYYGTTPVNKVQVHELAKDSLYNILKDVLTTFGPAKIKELKLDQYSGLYNIRNNTRGTAASVHSWAIAIDFYAAGNSFAAGNTAVFARPEYKPFIDIWYKHGWKSFGRELGYDWMHFQVADAPF